MIKDKIISAPNKSNSNPFKKLFKKHSICKVYNRFFKFHNKFFHYQDYDLDKEQAQLNTLEELKQ